MKLSIITKTRPCNVWSFFSSVKIEKLIGFLFFIFLIFTQKVDCWYTLELPHRGGFNKYQQSMFWSKKLKKRYTYLCIPKFCFIKVGFKGVYITWTCFHDDMCTESFVHAENRNYS